MNRLTKQYKDTKRYYSTHTCDEVLQKLGKLEDLEEVLEEYNVTLSNLREVLLVGQMFISKPTLEEVKKEWEDLGYKLYDGKNCMELYNKQKKYVIEVSFTRKSYAKYDKKYSSLLLTFQEHQLLHKLFELWGWFDE